MFTSAQRRRAIVAATVGNGLEFHDFITFDFFATQIGHTFCSWSPGCSRSPAIAWYLTAVSITGLPAMLKIRESAPVRRSARFASAVAADV